MLRRSVSTISVCFSLLLINAHHAICATISESDCLKKNTYSVRDWWNGSRIPFSPEIHKNGSVTFRLKTTGGKQVYLLIGDWQSERFTMNQTEHDLWELTVPNLLPGIYTYLFEVDGNHYPDLRNPSVKVGTEIYGSVLEIRGANDSKESWNPNGEYGIDHIHRFYSPSLKQFRNYIVHTPPGYNTSKKNTAYPVLYLRHGGGDHSHSWMDDGRAGIILDNLISSGTATPMIIVMPECLTDGSWAGGSDPEGIHLLEKELFEIIMPDVESVYQPLTGSAHTAIAGLSMGGGQSFLIGFNHPDRFGWIGEFSSGLLSAVEFDIEDRIPGFSQKIPDYNEALKLVYLACGKDDPRYFGHLEFERKLYSLGLHHQFHEQPGGHEWNVWRSELSNFLKLIFKPAIEHSN